MDIEKPVRIELMNALSEHFICFEEVNLFHALLPKQIIRADVVAFPRGDQLAGCGIAFETKLPTAEIDSANFAEVIKQSSDYVYASVAPDDRVGEYVGRRINSSFVFPSQPFRTQMRDLEKEFGSNGAEVLQASGALQLALHFRVGRAYWEKAYPDKRFALAFGRNDVWNSQEGFLKRGEALFNPKRRLGTKRVDFISEIENAHGTAKPMFDTL
jgi:hypothetical protein